MISTSSLNVVHFNISALIRDFAVSDLDSVNLISSERISFAIFRDH